MDLSVVVPTLNARDELAGCLDALSEHAPEAELLVVNGPSADGTTGMIRERDDIDVLVELADRTINAARNAGIDRASGETIAFMDHTYAIAEGWRDAIEREISRFPCVTGPTTARPDGGSIMAEPDQRSIAGRSVSYFNPGNVAFTRSVLEALDGFDEYLDVGGSRDFAHRLAKNDYTVGWSDEMTVRHELSTDGGTEENEWGLKYRSLAYRLVKNYHLRPTVVWRLLRHATADGMAELRNIFTGDARPSEWLGNGRTVVSNLVRGTKDGLGARRSDESRRRNPRGLSSRADRAVTVYDWR